MKVSEADIASNQSGFCFSRLLQGQHSAILLAFQIVSTATLLIFTVSFCKFLTDPGIEQAENHSDHP